MGGIAAAGSFAQPVARLVSEKLEQFDDADAWIVILEIAPGRLVAAVDNRDVVGVNAGQDRLDAAFRLGAGRARQRLGLAHQRAQVGIFPFLYAPVRQTFRVETFKRILAQGRDRALAGQRIACRRKGSAQRLLGRGLHGANFRVHQAASSANCA